jgi:hypothetical protein
MAAVHASKGLLGNQRPHGYLQRQTCQRSSLRSTSHNDSSANGTQQEREATRNHCQIEQRDCRIAWQADRVARAPDTEHAAANLEAAQKLAVPDTTLWWIPGGRSDWNSKNEHDESHAVGGSASHVERHTARDRFHVPAMAGEVSPAVPRLLDTIPLGGRSDFIRLAEYVHAAGAPPPPQFSHEVALPDPCVQTPLWSTSQNVLLGHHADASGRLVRTHAGGNVTWRFLGVPSVALILGPSCHHMLCAFVSNFGSCFVASIQHYDSASGQCLIRALEYQSDPQESSMPPMQPSIYSQGKGMQVRQQCPKRSMAALNRPSKPALSNLMEGLPGSWGYSQVPLPGKSSTWWHTSRTQNC